METFHSLCLIDGLFTPQEANNVLLTLVQNKITFHNLEIFSLEERDNQLTGPSKKRLEALKEMNEKLIQIIQYADKNNKQLKVFSSINIEIIQS